jgi:TolA-binding protein
MSVRSRAEGVTQLLVRRSARKSRKRFVLSVAGVVTALGIALLARRWLDSRHVAALSYTVESGQIGRGGIVEGNGGSEPRLRFSDGTEVLFFPGSSGQVRSIDEHGARVAVTGKAKVDVVHWRGSHWLFDVGPFLITVKGTSFTAEWNEHEERLEIVLKTGTVAVSGPSADEAITLRAGQRLIVSMRNNEFVIRDIDSKADPAAVAAAASRPWGEEVVPPTPLQIDEAPSSKPSNRAAPRERAQPAIGSRATTWTAELNAGRFAVILGQAEQRGLQRSLDGASSDDLAALADAARYSRREDIARAALAAQRRRFPATPHANDAAFLLGRLEEAAQHFEVALGWYERCLNESPGGGYTSEALGRKMTLVERLQGASRARPFAEEYLRRFANGTYAAPARALARAP